MGNKFFAFLLVSSVFIFVRVPAQAQTLEAKPLTRLHLVLGATESVADFTLTTTSTAILTQVGVELNPPAGLRISYISLWLNGNRISEPLAFIPGRTVITLPAIEVPPGKHRFVFRALTDLPQETTNTCFPSFSLNVFSLKLGGTEIVPEFTSIAGQPVYVAEGAQGESRSLPTTDHSSCTRHPWYIFDQHFLLGERAGNEGIDVRVVKITLQGELAGAKAILWQGAKMQGEPTSLTNTPSGWVAQFFLSNGELQIPPTGSVNLRLEITPSLGQYISTQPYHTLRVDAAGLGSKSGSNVFFEQQNLPPRADEPAINTGRRQPTNRQ